MKIENLSAIHLWSTPNAEEEIEAAGRTCYRSEDKIAPGTAARFIRMLRGRGHESVLEHASASFRVVCDRGVSHEIVRHRLASYSQESTRYCNYGADKHGGISVIPMMEGLTDGQVSRREALYRHAEEVYLAEIEEGVPPQQARDNLPTCLKTEIVWTANFREWMHILQQRTSKAAHPQMRVVAGQIKDALVRLAPSVFGE